MVRIGQLSKASGVSVRTIRYYADIGLLSECERSQSGYRQFNSDHLTQLRFIRSARNLGLSLDQVHALLATPGECERRCDAARKTILIKVKDIERQIANLQTQKRELLCRVNRPEEMASCAPHRSLFCPVVEAS